MVKVSYAQNIKKALNGIITSDEVLHPHFTDFTAEEIFSYFVL